MSKRPAPLKFEETPVINAALRKVGKDDGGGGKKMLSARINAVNARQFLAYAKLTGVTAQTLLDQAIAEFLERHRI